MFSRAAKSVVKSLSQRKYYAGEDNLKITLIGTTEGIHNLNASRLSRHQHSTLNTIPIYDVAGINKRFLFTQNRPHHFNETKSFCQENSRMLMLMGKSRSYESTSKQDSTMKENRLSYLTDHRLNGNEINTEKLIETLHRLPIGEEVGSMMNQRYASKAGDTCTGKLRSMMTRILDEMGQHDNTTRQVCQKNDILSEIIDWLLQPIDPFGKIANVTTLSASPKEKGRKLTKKKNMSKRYRKKNVKRNLAIVAPFVKVTVLKKSETGHPTFNLINEQKMNIRKDKLAKKNNHNESKLYEGGHVYTTNVKNKSKDWTVPAAFTNKKPRLLHDFSKANDKARSSWFLSKVFDNKNIQNDDYLNLKRFIAVSEKVKPRFYGIVQDDNKCNTNPEQISIKDDQTINLKSQSVSQIVPLDYVTLPTKDLRSLSGEFIDDLYENKTNCEIQEEAEHISTEVPIETKEVDYFYNENEESLSSSQTDEKENDFYEKWRPVEKVSSTVRSLLENVRRKKIIEKSSNSSIDSYHLDDFFKNRSLSAGMITNFFSNTSKENLDNCLGRYFYSPSDQNSIEPSMCLKERQEISFHKNRNPSNKDPCAKPNPSKKDPCAKPDPCKKDPCAKPDPCKKDPCAKPDPCKKDPCAKPDPCKKDPCAKPDPCKKDPCAKPDPCKKDPCAKPDPCKKDPCAKPDPCKKDPCGKPDPCKKDPCGKPDPCKKDPCAKPNPRKKCATSDFRPKRNSCKTEKTDIPPDCPDKKSDTRVEKQCPPVIRAPDCPDDSKKDENICRVPSIYYFKDEFLYKKLMKTKYVKFIFPDKNMPTNEIDITKKSNFKRIRTNMELPKLYTLDTFGINYSMEDY